jgi:phosphoribosyl 1,2-cyclic phosphodiesterase
VGEILLVRFWGVRGSLPSPLVSSAIKEKISAIIEQMTPEDIANPESKKRFLAGLPPWLCGTVGSNTPCVSVSFKGFNDLLIFDCGSGMRELGAACRSWNPMPENYHTFFSHFHWDHLQGLPFFYPAYNPLATLNFYSPKPALEEYLRGQMIFPYFPIQMDNMTKNKYYYQMKTSVSIGPATVTFREMNHPGGSFSYKVSYNGKTFIYATDTELSARDFVPTNENTGFFKDVDIIILDAQYTLGEAINKYNWGHSAFSLAVDFAANWGIKRLVLFHFDPAYDDRKLHEILQLAQWYLQRMDFRGEMEISLATEGMEISL